MTYGDRFAEHLAGMATADLSYLAAVAQLDRAWTEAHLAADAKPLQASELNAVVTQQLEVKRHPAARCVYFEDNPAAAFWQATREGETELANIAWQSSGALLTRPEHSVIWRAIEPAVQTVFNCLQTPRTISQWLDQASPSLGAAVAAQAVFTLIQSGAITLN
jgi:hypothetical protein